MWEIWYGLILAEIMEPCDFAIFEDQNMHMPAIWSV